MNPEKYIEFLNKIEKLKCNTRHSWTSSGRHESVAEHSWRLAVMAMLCADEYPNLDISETTRDYWVITGNLFFHCSFHPIRLVYF